MDSKIIFYRFNDLKEHCLRETGTSIYSGVGIFHNKRKNVSILRSVDGTYYYDDNLEEQSSNIPEELCSEIGEEQSSENNDKFIEYTLFGQVGDQDRDEKRFNKPLFDEDKNIYVYRVSKINRKKVWIWYGKYEIVGTFTKRHIDRNYKERKIIIAYLKKISDIV